MEANTREIETHSASRMNIFAITNRMDIHVLRALQEELGTQSRFCYIVEDSFQPEAAIMEQLRKERAAGLFFSARHTSSAALHQKLEKFLSQGYQVILLTKRQEEHEGGLCEVPLALLNLIEAAQLTVTPVYVSPLSTQESAADCELSFALSVPPCKGQASLIQSAWTEAAAEQMTELVNREADILGPALYNALKHNPNACIIDGIDDSVCTYDELLETSMQLAKYLHQRYQSHKRLGIILPPGKYAIIANIACIFAGITPVNINYNFSKKRLAQVMAQSELKLSITETRFYNRLRSFAWPMTRDLIFIDKELQSVAKGKSILGHYLHNIIHPSADIAWISENSKEASKELFFLFTRGSCSEPKPVSITHRMVLAGFEQCCQSIELESGSCVLSFMPYFNMAALTMGLIHPLLRGNDIITYPDSRLAQRLAQLSSNYQAELTLCTPSYLRTMLKQVSQSEKPVNFDKLRYFITVGESLPSNFYQLAKDSLGVELFEAYSLTEVASLVCIEPCNRHDKPQEPSAKPSKSVGTPLQGTAVRIADPDDPNQRLKPGQVGMIWLKGSAVAGDPRYGGWLRTGDIGGINAAGHLFIQGRTLRFSKVEGEMVPHQSLEQALYRYMNRTQQDKRELAIVGVQNDQSGKESLILLSCLHTSFTPPELVGMRYGLMNLGYPGNWCPARVIPVKEIPELAEGVLDYETCLAMAKHALGFR